MAYKVAAPFVVRVEVPLLLLGEDRLLWSAVILRSSLTTCALTYGRSQSSIDSDVWRYNPLLVLSIRLSVDRSVDQSI